MTATTPSAQACQFGPILFLSAWAGVIVDRMSKRKLLLVTQSLAMCQSFVLGALAFMHDAPLAAFYVTALAGGCLLAQCCRALLLGGQPLLQ